MQQWIMPTTSTESGSRTINVRLPLHVFEQLEALASATARTKSFVTLEALSTYLEAQSWQVHEIKARLVDAEQGEFASDEEVTAVFAKYGA